jgi:uncharacterized membrane protein
MSAITVYKFDTPEGADEMLHLMQGLQRHELITLQDAAIVSWPEDHKKPKTLHFGNFTGVGALGGAFWGLLFGLIFSSPFFGAAVGAGIGSMTGKFTDYGIDKKFIQQIGEQVTKGTSAFFLLSDDAKVDAVTQEVRQQGWNYELIATNLTQEQEQELRADFGL